VCRRFDFELHEVKEVGAARNELRIAYLRGGRCRFSGSARAFVGEGFHARLRETSVIASTMLE
jgi:hypothetical protein